MDVLNSPGRDARASDADHGRPCSPTDARPFLAGLLRDAPPDFALRASSDESGLNDTIGLPFDVASIQNPKSKIQNRSTLIADEIPKPPQLKKSKPWGLFAKRAPYPYYDGPFTMDCDDDLVARDIFFDFHAELWFAPGDTRGAATRMRAHFGPLWADAAFVQGASYRSAIGFFQNPPVRDYAYITHASGHLGASLPIPQFGYLDAGIGFAGFDQTNGLSRAGLSFKAGLLVYPIWPLGLELEAQRAQFIDGTAVNEFNLRAHVQVFRHIFVTAGWKWLNVDGGNFGTHGFTFGISFVFGNLRTFFWDPMKGPAY
ncbi:MAG: hypothetical protein IT462_12605 [Planctomycetes bacterium]|nr:hypothetical protein [Planctomycetota bacterium]